MINLINMSYLLAYLFPIKYFESIFKIQIDKIIFIIFMIFMIFYNKKVKISKIGFLFISFIIYRIILLKDIAAINLLILWYIYENREKSFNKISNIKLYFGGILLYSFIYFGDAHRYAHTSVKEPNISGFYIFLLVVLLYFTKEKLFYLVLGLGIFTFSRNYLLCIFMFIFLEKQTNIKILLLKIKNFYLLSLIAITFLICLGEISEQLYKLGKIPEWREKNFVQRITNPIDYSNYFRFTANTNVFKIFFNNPEKIITGVTEEEFKQLSYIYSKNEGQLYVGNKPHNYFFNYIRIYGVFSLFIFYILGKILNRRVTINSISFYVCMLVYANLLGVGFNSYNLFIVISIFDYINIKNKNDNCQIKK